MRYIDIPIDDLPSGGSGDFDAIDCCCCLRHVAEILNSRPKQWSKCSTQDSIENTDKLLLIWLSSLNAEYVLIDKSWMNLVIMQLPMSLCLSCLTD